MTKPTPVKPESVSPATRLAEVEQTVATLRETVDQLRLTVAAQHVAIEALLATIGEGSASTRSSRTRAARRTFANVAQTAQNP